MIEGNTRKKAEYRNSIRSKNLIRNAFIQLTNKKDIVKIKVKDIIEIADVSKGTFYAHYTCVQDVLLEIENEYLLKMFRAFDEHKPREILDDFTELFKSITDIMENDRIFFSILAKSSFADSFTKRMRGTFVEYMMSDNAVVREFTSPEAAKTYFTYAAGGAFVIIRRWLESTLDISSKETVECLNNFIVNGMKSIRK